MADAWEVYTLDVSRVESGLLAEYISVEAISRLNRPGNFVMTFDGDLAVADRIDYRSGILLRRNHVTVFSGHVTDIKRHVVRGTGSRGTITISGRDNMGFLEDRIAYPDPDAYPEDWLVVGDFQENVASEVAIRHYIEKNAVLGQAQQERSINGFSMGDYGGLGRPITRDARCINLMELVGGILDEDTSIRLRMVDVGDEGEAHLIEAVIEPRLDLSARLLLGLEIGNLDAVDVTEQRATANLIVIGGDGDGAGREMNSVGDSASVNRYGRVEIFEDGRGSASTAEMLQQGITTARKSRGGLVISATGRDDVQPRYGIDYQLGDMLGIEWQGERYGVTATEAKISLSRDGSRVIPLFNGIAETTDSELWPDPS